MPGRSAPPSGASAAPQAAAGNGLRSASAHLVWGRRREGAVLGVRDVAPRHFACRLCCA